VLPAGHDKLNPSTRLVWSLKNGTPRTYKSVHRITPVKKSAHNNVYKPLGHFLFLKPKGVIVD